MLGNLLITTILLFVFLFVTILVFTMPGYGILKILKAEFTDNLEEYAISTVFGLVVFTLFAYVLAVLHLRFLIWTLPILGLFWFLKYFKNIFSRKKKPEFKRNTLVYFIFVLIFGIVLQVAVNAPSGFKYGEDILFWSAHGRDGMWHIALMEEMKRNIFPFQNPEYAGHILKNYHFFVDLMMSEMSRLFGFSNLDIYFRFVPVLLSLLLGLGSFIVVRLWIKDEKAGIWAMIFTYFAGSFGFIVTLIKNKTIGGETIFWMNQTPSVLGNPPQAAAFVVFLAFLFILLKYIHSGRLAYIFLAIILGGTIIEFKVYGGLIVLGSLLILGIYELFFKRKYQMTLLFGAVFLVSFFLYFPNSSGSGKFIIFEPWWFIRTMVVDKLGLIDWELRRQTYLSVGRFTSYLRILELETVAFLIYLIGNLGVRVIGFIKIFKDIFRKEKIESLSLFLISASVISFVIPLLFLQRGVVYNSIQFSQYFLLFMGLLAAVSVNEIMNVIKPCWGRLLLVLAILLLAIPTHLGLLWQFYANKPLAKVSASELQALNFLRTVDPNSVILTAPYNEYSKNKYKFPPIPIYAWSDTGYITALSGRRTLISDAEQVDIMGYDAKALLKERNEAFIDKSGNLLTALVKSYNVDYIYLNKGEEVAFDLSKLDIKNVFTNDEVSIYSIK